MAILATAGGENAHRWILANALAWAVAMPVIFFGMDHVPWGRSAPLVWATLYVVCGASGLLVGAIHGRFLVTLVDNPSLAPTD